jgi:hypothetical protein
MLLLRKENLFLRGNNGDILILGYWGIFGQTAKTCNRVLAVCRF